MQCGLHFELQAPSFQTERSCVAYMVSYLTGRAEKWATAEWARDSPVCSSVQLFTETLCKGFDHTACGREAARALMDLRQGNRRVSAYAVEFRTLATDSAWNEAALFDAFMRGLAESIRDHLTALELPNGVDSLIALVIKIDNRIQLREEERSRLHVRLILVYSPGDLLLGSAQWLPHQHPRGFGGAYAVGSYQTHGRGATTLFAWGQMHLLRADGPLHLWMPIKEPGFCEEHTGKPYYILFASTCYSSIFLRITRRLWVSISSTPHHTPSFWVSHGFKP